MVKASKNKNVTIKSIDKPAFPRNHQFNLNNRGGRGRGRGRGNYKFQRGYNKNYPPWNTYHYNNHYPKRYLPIAPIPEPPPPPLPPTLGSEEHTQQKIRDLSEVIKKQLSNPPSKTLIENPKPPEAAIEKPPESTNKQAKQEAKPKCNPTALPKSKQEIYDRFMHHITKLNDGRKKNLINFGTSSFDTFISQIQKQKRLETSRATRESCSQETNIESVIPDLDITIDSLPPEFIQQLSSTFNIEFNNFDSFFLDSKIDKDVACSVKVKDEVMDEVEDEVLFVDLIKPEPDEVGCIDVKCEVDNVEVSFDNPGPEVEVQPELKCDESMEIVNHNLDDEIVGERRDFATQTDLEKPSLQSLISTYISSTDCSSKSLSDLVVEMFGIDEAIGQLTNYRQSMFLKYKNGQGVIASPERKSEQAVEFKSDVIPVEQCKTVTVPLDFTNIQEKVLAIKIFGNDIISATESGKLYIFNNSASIMSIIEITNVPLTAICIIKNKENRNLMYISSFDSVLRIFDYHTMELIKNELLDNSVQVQCLETTWECIFLGTLCGNLIRYSLEKQNFPFSEKISENTIFAIKATTEGGRRVLLVATRLAPICVRDAMSGLHLRTMEKCVAPTVYAIALDKSLVYCGTPNRNILVFSFHNGKLMHELNATNSKGIGCIKIVDNLLYASCHNGSIYVYSTKSYKHIGKIEGPGGVILSMEVFQNQIIVGTMSYQFKAIPIPNYILQSD